MRGGLVVEVVVVAVVVGGEPGALRRSFNGKQGREGTSRRRKKAPRDTRSTSGQYTRRDRRPITGAARLSNGTGACVFMDPLQVLYVFWRFLEGRPSKSG